MEGLTAASRGERSPNRINQRNGYREWTWEMGAGTVALEIPKLRRGSYFPAFLEPRRASEKVLTAVLSRRPTCRACRHARSTTWSRPSAWLLEEFSRSWSSNRDKKRDLVGLSRIAQATRGPSHEFPDCCNVMWRRGHRVASGFTAPAAT